MKVSAPGYQKANGEPVEMFKRIVEESKGKGEEDKREKEEETEEEKDI